MAEESNAGEVTQPKQNNIKAKILYVLFPLAVACQIIGLLCFELFFSCGGEGTGCGPSSRTIVTILIALFLLFADWQYLRLRKNSSNSILKYFTLAVVIISALPVLALILYTIYTLLYIVALLIIQLVKNSSI